MNRDTNTLLMTLVAIAVFVVVTLQTVGALRASGAWSGHGQLAASAPADPLSNLDRLLGQTDPALATAPMRSPFELGSAPAIAGPVRPVVRKPVVPAAPEKPVLTAIVWDADPRALLRWKGQNYTVHRGGLFDEFQVSDITRDQVTLARGNETIVLQRKPQGD